MLLHGCRDVVNSVAHKESRSDLFRKWRLACSGCVEGVEDDVWLSRRAAGEGILDVRFVEWCSFNDRKAFCGFQGAGFADECCDCVPVAKSFGGGELASTATGAKYQDVHVEQLFRRQVEKAEVRGIE